MNAKTILKYILLVVGLTILLMLPAVFDGRNNDSGTSTDQPEQPYLCDYKTTCS